VTAKRIKSLAIIILAAAFLLSILRPAPNTEFLYRNFPELQGHTPRLKSSSVAFFLDPSFFYKFTATEQEFGEIVSQLELEPIPNDQRDYYQEYVFGRNKPLPWHSWWWRPNFTLDSLLFSGHRNGNQLYLLYDSTAHVIYLYIQNT
jgi:hypothetical protein